LFLREHKYIVYFRGIGMTDITDSINNAINIVEKRINFQEKEANEPYMLELYGHIFNDS
jgi:hypothetical protein